MTESNVGSRRLSITAVFAVALISAVFPMYSRAGSVSLLPSHCRDRLIRDYEEPLRHMPRHQGPPEGELAFAPRDLSIRPIAPRRVVLQGRTFGYQFEASRPRTALGRLRHPLKLDWNVTTTLWSVDHRGRQLQVIDRDRRRFGEVHDVRNLDLAVAARPGLYRFDMDFQKYNGTVLAVFSEYFRVVPRRVRVRVGLSQPVLHAGEIELGQLENLGTEFMSLPNGEQLNIEHLENGQWTQVPTDVSNVTVVGAEPLLWGGFATRCSSFTIAPETLPGLYRFSIAAKPAGSPLRVVTGEFSVVQ